MNNHVVEFARITSVGLGRAVLQLQAESAAPLRAVVLDTCLHNATYDVQVEESRAQYLFDLIAATGEPDFFRSRLIQALTDDLDDRDLSQITALLALYARAGDSSARQALYDAYVARAESDHIGLDATIVELDGAAGLLFVAELLRLDQDEDKWDWPDPSHLVELATAKDGPEQVQRVLAQGAAASQRIARFAAAATAERHSEPPAALVEDVTAWSYERIRRRFDADDFWAGSLLQRWANTATPSALELVARDLAREANSQRQRAYLRVFWHHRFPLDPAPILQLATHGDEATRPVALTALRAIPDARVRSLGLDLLAQGNGRGAGLLPANYQHGDYPRLEGLLNQWQDRDSLHDLGFGLLEVAKAHPLREAVPALLTLYERGPCSMCRLHALEYLREVDTIPAWVAQECRFDANPQIQLLVQSQATDRGE